MAPYARKRRKSRPACLLYTTSWTSKPGEAPYVHTKYLTAYLHEP